MNIPSNNKDEIVIRVQAICENWCALISAHWQNTGFENLLTRLDGAIVATKNTTEVAELYDSLIKLKTFLITLSGRKIAPSTNEIAIVDNLLAQLNILIHSSTLSQNNVTQKIDFYLLSSRCRYFAELVQRLKEASIIPVCFSDAQAMMYEATQNKPAGYLIDRLEEPQFKEYIDDFKKIKTIFDTDPAKFFYCDEATIETRLKAIRNGAKWVLSSDADIQHNVQKIIESTKATIVDTQEQYKVMIVEDDVSQANYAAKVLGKANIKTIVVMQPLDVIDKLLEFKPDLILMDLYMPDANGFEMTSLIREYKEFAQTPIVFLSGEDNPERQLEAISVGGDEFLVKPIRPKQLIKTVKSRIQRYKKININLNTVDVKPISSPIFSRHEFLHKVTEALKTSYVETTAIFYCRVEGQGKLSRKYGLGGMDQLIDEIGKTIDEHLNSNEIVAKADYHGLTVLARRESNNKLIRLAEHLKELVEFTQYLIGQQKIKIILNIGVCLFDENLDDAHGLSKRAESACHYIESKNSTDVHIYSIADEEPRDNTTLFIIKMYDKIHQALADNSFTIHYQPIINLKNQSQKNYSVQYHLFTDNGDQVPQRIILRAASESGNQPALDQLILDQSIETHTQRKRTEDSQLFIPQSIDSLLLEDGYVEDILQYLRRWHIIGQGIILSFSYSDLKKEIKAIKSQFDLLKKVGIHIMITDLEITVNALKVVQYLKPQYVIPTKEILRIKQHSLKSYMDKLHQLNLKIIIQQINHPKDFVYFWKSGADYLQGDFIQPASERMSYDFSQNPAGKIKLSNLKN